MDNNTGKPETGEESATGGATGHALLQERQSAVGRSLDTAMAIALGVMAVLVFVNVVLRYGFGTGIASAEELSRLLFVWMVFIGAVAAYPVGEHMAFTSLLAMLTSKPRIFACMTLLVRLLMLLGCVLLACGAWLQVGAAWGSESPVMGYPVALLPLPVLLGASAIGAMVVLQIVRREPMHLGHTGEVE